MERKGKYPRNSRCVLNSSSESLKASLGPIGLLVKESPDPAEANLGRLPGGGEVRTAVQRA